MYTFLQSCRHKTEISKWYCKGRFLECYWKNAWTSKENGCCKINSCRYGESGNCAFGEDPYSRSQSVSRFRRLLSFNVLSEQEVLYIYRAETNTPPVFSTNSYLVDEEKELEFLRKLCEIMIILLLPRGYSLPPLKVLLSEMLSYKS